MYFDCLTGKVIHQQTVKLEQVTADLKNQFNIDEQQLHRRIFYALSTFNRFPAGEYILRSDKSDLVKVYEKTTAP